MTYNDHIWQMWNGRISTWSPHPAVPAPRPQKFYDLLPQHVKQEPSFAWWCDAHCPGQNFGLHECWRPISWRRLTVLSCLIVFWPSETSYITMVTRDITTFSTRLHATCERLVFIIASIQLLADGVNWRVRIYCSYWLDSPMGRVTCGLHGWKNRPAPFPLGRFLLSAVFRMFARVALIGIRHLYFLPVLSLMLGLVVGTCKVTGYRPTVYE